MDQIEDCFHLGIKTLIRDAEGRVLLLEKHHRTRGIYWDIPGGRIQRGESILEALRRELEEETGLKGVEGAFPLTMVVTNIRIPKGAEDVGLILSIYRYDLPSAFVPQLSAEHKDFGWFPAAEAALLLKDQYSSDFIEQVAGL